jgi:hypothetical protein
MKFRKKTVALEPIGKEISSHFAYFSWLIMMLASVTQLERVDVRQYLQFL